MNFMECYPLILALQSNERLSRILEPYSYWSISTALAGKLSEFDLLTQFLSYRFEPTVFSVAVFFFPQIT